MIRNIIERKRESSCEGSLPLLCLLPTNLLILSNQQQQKTKLVRDKNKIKL